MKGLEQQLAREKVKGNPPQSRNPQEAGVAAALAQRLESLLGENERMREKVKFLEESVQLLSTDLENKRMLLQEFKNENSTTTSSEVTSAALSKAAASSSSETMETFLEKTLSENIQLKKDMEILLKKDVSYSPTSEERHMTDGHTLDNVFLD